ncbi:hypothetical protein [Ruegeria jejuensis]|uniref:hypothetical protein n=1 Tax=Ruegeria jejuensis TaxID=3233338 RepID=UPI00355C660F
MMRLEFRSIIIPAIAIAITAAAITALTTIAVVVIPVIVSIVVAILSVSRGIRASIVVPIVTWPPPQFRDRNPIIAIVIGGVHQSGRSVPAKRSLQLV